MRVVALDVTDATFETDVMERSTQVPVVVDLWAPWCGPCKTLGPIIEQVVAATEGRVALAKVDTDQNPQVAAAFKVQSIPAVYALRDRAVVDQFIGAKPERDVQAFVDGLVPSEEDERLAQLVGAGDEASLTEALEVRADHEPAVVAMAELLVRDGRSDEALELLARVPESPDVRRAAALARQGGDDAVVDVDAQLEALLPDVKTDDEARQRFVDLLELLGPDDPRTASWRKRLTAALF
jgi:putative thioredoxin